MPWELFDKVDKSFVPKISIRNNGNIGISSGAVNKFELAKKKCCKLYFDRDTNRIGIEFLEYEGNASTIKVARRGQDTLIVARPFLAFYEINYTETKIYIGEQDEKSGFIVIDLKKSLYTSTRGKRKKE